MTTMILGGVLIIDLDGAMSMNLGGVLIIDLDGAMSMILGGVLIIIVQRNKTKKQNYNLVLIDSKALRYEQRQKRKNRQISMIIKF